MLISEMKLGKPLEIYINRDGYHYKVVSKIEEVAQDHVSVTLIASRTRIFEFQSTDIVDIVYRDDERLWKWKNVTGGVITLDGEKFHSFTSKESGESFNRRSAFRVYVGERIVLHCLVHDLNRLSEIQDKEALHSQTVFNYDAGADVLTEDCYRYMDCDAVLKDISEVGAGIYTNQVMENGDEITFEYNTDFGLITCKAVVVRKLNSYQSSFMYYYGCRFTETSRNLTKYIYDMQRKQIKKTREKV